MDYVTLDKDRKQFVLNECTEDSVDAHEQCEGYPISFDQVETPVKFLGCLGHLSEKAWVSCGLLKELITLYANVFSVSVKLDRPTISTPIDLVGWIDQNVDKIDLDKLTEVIDSYRERFLIPYFE